MDYKRMTARSLEIEARLGDNNARAELYRRAEAAKRSKMYGASFKKTRRNPDAEAPASTPAVRLTRKGVPYKPRSSRAAAPVSPPANPTPASVQPASALPSLRMTKKGIPHKIQKGAKKIEREAAWSDKRRAHVERSRRVMKYARDLMQQLGWYPGEAIRVAWADEKAGKLAAYTPRDRAPVPEGLFEKVRIKNPFGYNF